MLAGAASIDITPALGLPMVGYVRRQDGASRIGFPLEANVLVLAGAEERVVLANVDNLGMDSPHVDVLRARVAEVAGADPAGVLLNWSHTHCAPPSTREFLYRTGLLATDGDKRLDDYAALLSDRIVEATRVATSRLEPAAVAWGVGTVDRSVNRREPRPDGSVVHGWRPDGFVDHQVVSFQVRRRDESVIATLVGFGCHPLTVGMDFPGYTADFPGPLRRRVREWTGGECLFFQGAGANILPRVAFTKDEQEAERMGTRIALEALRSLGDRPAWPSHIVGQSDGSLVPMVLFRFEPDGEEEVVVRAAEDRVPFPFAALPEEPELTAQHAEYHAALHEAIARGAGDAELCGLHYYEKWSRRILDDIRAGDAPQELVAPINAVRIGEGVIVSGPGEVFAEIGMAVKERSPGLPTLYAGYTNGCVGYFSTEASYVAGGYEPGYSHRSYGRPAPIAADCDRLLVERGVRLAETLFPERAPYQGEDWLATGTLPELPDAPLVRPEFDFQPPRTARHP
jgi:hypothetical protein